MAGMSYQAPLYLQMRELVRSKIEEGEYPPLTALPSECELAESCRRASSGGCRGRGFTSSAGRWSGT